MFTGPIQLVPGQELREFTVFRDGEYTTASGRVIANGREQIGTIWAVLAVARPEETERWRQLEHPVSHKIIQQGTPPFAIQPGDVFIQNNRRYLVQTAPYQIGGLSHWTIYYCNERRDV